MAGTGSREQEIKEFVQAHAHGWDHEAWVGFLDHLRGLGQDVSDPDRIGLELEGERLRSTLREAGVKGLGPKRIEAIAVEFGTLHNLKVADGAEIAARSRVPSQLAHEVAERLCL